MKAPQPNLSFLQKAGPEGLFFPPPQEVIPGIASYLNWPYAMVTGHRLLRLDVHIPHGASGPLPVIVFAPGGSWLRAPKNHAPWLDTVKAGFAVVSIEYRLSGEAQFPAQIHDVKAAIRWVRAHAGQFGFDAARIAGWGCSAGGYLMSMAGATNGLAEFEGEVSDHADQPSTLAAVIAHYAPSDLTTMSEDTTGQPATANSSEALLLGHLPSAHSDGAQLDVVTYVGETTVPFLLMHGDADTMLSINQSRRLFKALQAAGAPVEFHEVSGANHAGPEFGGPQVVEPTLAFLQRVLGPVK